MPSFFQTATQSIAYALFAALIGYFSVSPEYESFEPDSAMIRLVFSHPTQRVEECRKLSAEEMAKLAANMRQATECGRERFPLGIEVLLDEAPLLRGVHEPTGLWKDGPANVYEKIPVRPGVHRLVVRLRDSGRAEGYDYEYSGSIRLQAGRSVLVTFEQASGFRLVGDNG